MDADNNLVDTTNAKVQIMSEAKSYRGGEAEFSRMHQAMRLGNVVSVSGLEYVGCFRMNTATQNYHFRIQKKRFTNTTCPVSFKKQQNDHVRTREPNLVTLKCQGKKTHLLMMYLVIQENFL
mmetsp:Transcript_35225/g.40758  ORF Transcript_35225/g.40758 Transcript_35225/m.40758 type:complete len:122 (-) Transcript_35225:273-638(-)